MRRHLELALLACTLALPACARPVPETAPAPASTAAKAWLADVSAIADADASQGRRTAIGKRLDTLGIRWANVPFEIDGQHGTNILAAVSGDTGAPLLLLGAHSDQVSKGEGATDNASGSATVLALAERLKARPLANHRVAVAFWDLEEKGLLGSKAYVAAGKDKPTLYVNFDVFAWGDTVWMMTPDAEGALTRASQDATKSIGLKLSAGEQYPPTDHLAFLKSGWPAVSYSLIGADEITGILDAYAGKTPKAMPKVMQVIHTDGDTLAQVDANAAARGVDAVEAALRRWDAESASATTSSTTAK
ncbi:M28 family metallopeptidase [Lysobacter solisilvae (ex Woo and Kim 2020)]|uniref:M28 family peptidase n=1 Tax=Agrilutibacter terrestris TaxID=2865112 RepID=A0A7H0FX58_9GAMM|nr:M28 family metallopeptidase [Lysobacter terrestris]QNP40624.1 M28 family peptidase [Lysobacter terrestris]